VDKLGRMLGGRGEEKEEYLGYSFVWLGVRVGVVVGGVDG